MADKTVRGRFVWHELTTADGPASHGFYTKVLGWKTQPFEQDPSYTMFAASSGPVGGTATATDAPAHWLPYIGTPDIEATVAQATELGGSVVTQITSMANGGRYAVLADPQGARFGVYSSSSAPEKDRPAKRGEYSWHELLTSDYQAAAKFYSALFGWEKMLEHDMGEMGVYYIFGRNGRQLGGIMNAPAGSPAPFWLGYVRVKDVHQTAKKAQKSGAKLINGPMEVPEGDWIAQFIDPQGAMFAVHTLKADLAPSAPAAGPVSANADSLAETTVLTDVKPAEIKVSSTSAKPAKKAATKPAAKKPSKPAAKKPAAKAAKKSAQRPAAKKKAAGKKKKTAAKSTKRPARKVAKSAKKAPKKAQKKAQRKAKRGGKKKAARKPK